MPRTGSTRDQLIESTRELLWERGYAATSPRAILDRAGAGQGSMYHHFAGKEDLAAAAMRSTAQQLLGRAEADLTSDGSAFERVKAYLLRQREVLRGCPVGRMTGDAEVLESAVLQDVVATTFDQLRAHIVAVIRDGVNNDEFSRGVQPADLADTVLAVVQGGYVLARAAGDPAPFDRAVRGALAMLEHLRRKDNR
ncbi:TetR/AcrR family transcriptional regulator [Micromonospora sp. WMMD812]|uniref:TetR/AcrR family transcriptional regulator n=1 Tax=Micromonospora sp. WMMD812 TaxID=3015152 RepID=UPI00248A9B1D|nr:TetR/AcrR family transcriptional regulator [Micromonospora sp. WMMD812]WBB69543.1 TetR/AcrR family transcriptional regulator [Micromonospora sp. WMMD812]